MRYLAVLALLFVPLAACSSPESGGGGFFIDAHGACSADAKAVDACGSTTPTDAAGLPDGATPSADAAVTADGQAADADAAAAAGTDVDSGASDDPATDLDGFFDDPDASTGSTDGDIVVSPSGDCPERAKIVYVVTDDAQLYSFQPDKLLFTKVGTLKCPSGLAALTDTPFSMAVDRQANAWVLYWDGSTGAGIYKVSTVNAACSPTSYKTASSNLAIFGMGFSADQAGSSNETLYLIAGSSSSYWSGVNTLASISFPALQASAIQTLDFAGGAEVTGNGAGELFGFFDNSSPPSVRQIDKATAKTNIKNWTLPSSDFNGDGDIAFAQWGGAFYLFYQGPSDSSTNVWKLDTTTGVATIVKANTGLTIVGAGVSSCAPTSTAP